MEIILSNECSAFNLSHLKDGRDGDKACACVVSELIIQPEKRCESTDWRWKAPYTPHHITQSCKQAALHVAMGVLGLWRFHTKNLSTSPAQSVIFYVLGPKILPFHCRCILINNYCLSWHAHEPNPNFRRSTGMVMDNEYNKLPNCKCFNTFNKVQLSRHSFNKVLITPWAVCFSCFCTGLQLMTFMRTRL